MAISAFHPLVSCNYPPKQPWCCWSLSFAKNAFKCKPSCLSLYKPASLHERTPPTAVRMQICKQKWTKHTRSHTSMHVSIVKVGRSGAICKHASLVVIARSEVTSDPAGETSAAAAIPTSPATALAAVPRRSATASALVTVPWRMWLLLTW